MMPILVTGSTGFLGYWVTKKLLEQGESVRLIVRDEKKLAQEFINCERVVGDLSEKNLIDQAMDGCDRVVHVAGLVSTYSEDISTLYEINFQSAVKIFNSALKHKVKRLVYTSSSTCLGAYRYSDKKEKVSAESLNVPYIDSKLLALKEAIRYSTMGLPIIILCPTLMLGERDFKLSSSELIYSFIKREIPAYLKGGFNPVYVGDSAQAHVNALNYGQKGELYIIAGDTNLTLKEFFDQLEILTKVKGPRFSIPSWIAMGLAYLAEVFINRPKLNLSAIKLGRLYWYFDNNPMKQELKINPLDYKTTLKKSVAWIQNEFKEQ